MGERGYGGFAKMKGGPWEGRLEEVWVYDGDRWSRKIRN
jgi:hypothetical protein